jgi:hypothetical protein
MMGLKKRDTKHIFCIDFHILMGYFIGQKQKKYDRWASSKKVNSRFFVGVSVFRFSCPIFPGPDRIHSVSIF